MESQSKSTECPSKSTPQSHLELVTLFVQMGKPETDCNKSNNIECIWGKCCSPVILSKKMSQPSKVISSVSGTENVLYSILNVCKISQVEV